jgi:hypothetical protein
VITSLLFSLTYSLESASSEIIDKHEIVLNDGYKCVVEGLKTEDMAVLGGYNKIGITLYSGNELLDTIEIKDLFGLKLIETESIVLDKVNLFVKYTYADFLATPRSWFVTGEIYLVKNKKLLRIWKYDLEEYSKLGGAKTLFDIEYLDKERAIVLLKKKFKYSLSGDAQENEYIQEVYTCKDDQISRKFVRPLVVK